MDTTHGTVYWTELMTRDYDGARKFYGEVCGWTYSHMEGMEDSYAIAHVSDGPPVAGIGDMDEMQLEKEIPPHWLSYIAVDDINAAAEAVKSAGGSLKRDVFEVPKIGKIAIVVDPEGVVIGFIEPA